MYPYHIDISYPYGVAFSIILDAIYIYKLRKTPGFGKKEGWIINIIAMGIICALSDILCVVFPNYGVGRTLLYVVNAVFYCSFSGVCFLLLRYCDKSYISPSIKRSRLEALPGAVFNLVLVVSYWTGWFFAIDQENHYIRGRYYGVFYGILALYYFVMIPLLSLFFLHSEKDAKRKKLLKCNFHYGIVMIIGIICQSLKPSLPFISAGLNIMYLMIFTDNQERLYEEAVERRAEALKQKERVDLEAQIVQKNSELDGMTQIYNRSSGEKHVNELITQQRYGMFCMFDVDEFKRYNDTYGHSIGDEIICGIAQCMRETFRGDDILIRLGGDEFAVYAPEIKTEEVAARRIQELRRRVQQMQFPGVTTPVLLSVGTTYCGQKVPQNFEELFKITDERMYAQKQRNKSVVNIGRYDFEELSKELPVALFVYQADEEERIRFVSHTLISLFECESDEEFLKLTKSSFRHLVHPEDIERVEKEISQQVNSNINMGMDYVEYRIITAKGNVKTVLDYGHLVDSPKYGLAYFVMIAEKH